ncbi:MAG: hypothetical protein P8188_10515 [Gemmatimonadota bacterium]|jgi:hypothetical protein
MADANLLSRVTRRLGHELGRAATVVREQVVGPALSPWRRGQTVMFHIGRSGSTVLTDLLRQHPAVFWDGEVYERDLFGRYPYDGVPENLAVSSEKLLRSRIRRAGACIYGLEVKFFHLDLTGETLPGFMASLDTLDFRDVMILRRKNSLRKVVSSLIAHQNRDLYHRGAGEKSKVREVEIDLDRVFIDRVEKPLLDFLEEYDRRFDELDELLGDRRVLRLTYEEDVARDPRVGYERICRFLDIEPQPVEIRYARTNPFPLERMITNFGEVRDALRPTRFAWMLES